MYLITTAHVGVFTGGTPCQWGKAILQKYQSILPRFLARSEWQSNNCVVFKTQHLIDGKMLILHIGQLSPGACWNENMF